MATLGIGSSRSSASRATQGQSSGVKVTLIDFTLSRVQDRDAPAVYNSFDDECVFEGSGLPVFLTVLSPCLGQPT